MSTGLQSENLSDYHTNKYIWLQSRSRGEGKGEGSLFSGEVLAFQGGI